MIKRILVVIGAGVFLASLPLLVAEGKTEVGPKGKIGIHSLEKSELPPALLKASSRALSERKKNSKKSKKLKKYKSKLPRNFCKKFKPGKENTPDKEEFTIQVIYAYPKGANRFRRYRQLILGDIRYTDWFLKAKSKGRRAIAWDRGGTCGRRQIDILSLPLDQSAKEYKRMGDIKLFNALLDSIEEHVSDDNKHYLLYADNVVGRNFGASGIGHYSTDDSLAADNDHIKYPFTGVVLGSGGKSFNGNWHLSRRSTLIHEMFHGLGAVAPDAPGSAGNGHCYDGWDVMCGWEAGRRPCQPWKMRIDCERNTYFAVNPSGWLKTHWNTANSPYLYGGSFRKELIEGTNPSDAE